MITEQSIKNFWTKGLAECFKDPYISKLARKKGRNVPVDYFCKMMSYRKCYPDEWNRIYDEVFRKKLIWKIKK